MEGNLTVSGPGAAPPRARRPRSRARSPGAARLPRTAAGPPAPLRGMPAEPSGSTDILSACAVGQAVPRRGQKSFLLSPCPSPPFILSLPPAMHSVTVLTKKCSSFPPLVFSRESQRFSKQINVRLLLAAQRIARYVCGRDPSKLKKRWVSTLLTLSSREQRNGIPCEANFLSHRGIKHRFHPSPHAENWTASLLGY